MAKMKRFLQRLCYSRLRSLECMVYAMSLFVIFGVFYSLGQLHLQQQFYRGLGQPGQQIPEGRKVLSFFKRSSGNSQEDSDDVKKVGRYGWRDKPYAISQERWKALLQNDIPDEGGVSAAQAEASSPDLGGRGGGSALDEIDGYNAFVSFEDVVVPQDKKTTTLRSEHDSLRSSLNDLIHPQPIQGQPGTQNGHQGQGQSLQSHVIDGPAANTQIDTGKSPDAVDTETVRAAASAAAADSLQSVQSVQGVEVHESFLVHQVRPKDSSHETQSRQPHQRDGTGMNILLGEVEVGDSPHGKVIKDSEIDLPWLAGRSKELPGIDQGGFAKQRQNQQQVEVVPHDVNAGVEATDSVNIGGNSAKAMQSMQSKQRQQQKQPFVDQEDKNTQQERSEGRSQRQSQQGIKQYITSQEYGELRNEAHNEQGYEQSNNQGYERGYEQGYELPGDQYATTKDKNSDLKRPVKTNSNTQQGNEANKVKAHGGVSQGKPISVQEYPQDHVEELQQDLQEKHGSNKPSARKPKARQRRRYASQNKHEVIKRDVTGIRQRADGSMGSVSSVAEVNNKDAGSIAQETKRGAASGVIARDASSVGKEAAGLSHGAGAGVKARGSNARGGNARGSNAGGGNGVVGDSQAAGSYRGQGAVMESKQMPSWQVLAKIEQDLEKEGHKMQMQMLRYVMHNNTKDNNGKGPPRPPSLQVNRVNNNGQQVVIVPQNSPYQGNSGVNTEYNEILKNSNNKNSQNINENGFNGAKDKLKQGMRDILKQSGIRDIILSNPVKNHTKTKGKHHHHSHHHHHHNSQNVDPIVNYAGDAMAKARAVNSEVDYNGNTFRSNNTKKYQPQEIELDPKILAEQPKIYMALLGRMGNHLFHLASLYGIARKTHRTPVVSPGAYILEAFDAHIKDVFAVDEAPSNILTIHEDGSGVYSPKVYNLPQNADVQLCCYFQSWRYFTQFSDELRDIFTFKPWIISRAQSILNMAKKDYMTMQFGRQLPKYISHMVTFVGVHVRRSDHLLTEHLKKGYKPASLSYFNKAMDYYRQKYANVYFIVCSDEIAWAKDHLRDRDVYFVEGQDGLVDLGVLAACNHTVTSVGTFSWWAGWLAGGEVTYYSDWPVPGTEIDKNYKHYDYFMPHWKPFGD